VPRLAALSCFRRDFWRVRGGRSVAEAPETRYRHRTAHTFGLENGAAKAAVEGGGFAAAVSLPCAHAGYARGENPGPVDGTTRPSSTPGK
jgi:hypothetical protein